jgi:hypothetical protein
MRGISEALVTPAAMENMAKSLATYYRTLVDAGMEKELANQMTLIQSTQMNHMTTRHGLRAAYPAPPAPPARPAPPSPPSRSEGFRTTETDE